MTMGTTAAESMNASANIFLGQSEAPLMIRPYLKVIVKHLPPPIGRDYFQDMTKSEIHAVMTGGFATIAGSVLAAYIRLIKQLLLLIFVTLNLWLITPAMLVTDWSRIFFTKYFFSASECPPHICSLPQ